MGAQIQTPGEDAEGPREDWWSQRDPRAGGLACVREPGSKNLRDPKGSSRTPIPHQRI